MKEKFKIIFLEEALSFLHEINEKASKKLIWNLKKAKETNDPKAFKKLDDVIWEVRAENRRLQYRLLAFWDKSNNMNTLVVCSHGFIKKTEKIPSKELEKARAIRYFYFLKNEQKNENIHLR